ncbi:hypothetical protein AAA799E16_00871 [Marine Group I thaumarchaeote SCGC AAA799-E16]|uniref:Uncharacterized protein n=4 Tax=Marine Group I TaxID=905826 RepID=A0A081RM23_9ARCH|nr:hypothetical protein AAA799N04_01331 [Marine Group I thaumarchaeote SCGC AAA799-N04]KER06359.1 hypothetical protein AAA799E16_00871 [Marine Group I thaumarchaeote SCGC AAA799-E16]KFM17227.1 hypothetical protein AAA799D11_00286 [Marine Group I thaumarchaeote SCGC AAA799-D11]KFM19084.1 hypothetical protein SCCGRSA3_00659 [Marine Group I thaumarchaeote SCGC RSA3]
MINPELLRLLETNDVLDVLRDSVSYQLQKLNNVEKTSEGRDWYAELPAIVKGKFDNYKEDYEKLLRILQSDNLSEEMNKGYYYWRLIRSACNTYRNDLKEYDLQLSQEFNLQETKAISENDLLNECIGVLEQHAVENHDS